MSLSANMRDDTGRRAKTVKLTAEEEELRIQLQYFEARYDPEDADQVATHPVGKAAELMVTEAVQVLEEMREHTRRLEQARGIWDKRGAPGGVRDHNEFRIDANKDKAALPDASLAAYKQHKADERAGHKPKLLEDRLRQRLPPRARASATEQADPLVVERVAVSRAAFLKARGLEEDENKDHLGW